MQAGRLWHRHQGGTVFRMIALLLLAALFLSSISTESAQEQLRNSQSNPALLGAEIPATSVAEANFWIKVSACLVLVLAVPGLILFYGGLLNASSLPRLLAQAAGIALLVTFLWWLFGYSFVFADGAGPIIGNFGRFAFLRSLNTTLNAQYGFQGSQRIFCAYELMFAIVAPLIIVGPLAGRVRFSLLLVFVTFWMLLVYFPLAHMVWGIDGLMNGLGNPHARIRAIDFGGGMVVQVAAGLSGLILFLILGRPSEADSRPISQLRLILCLAGEAMLWIGWYGFNSGGAAMVGASAQVFTNTTLATLVSAFAWAVADMPTVENPTNLRFCGGAIAGLAAITPGAGFVTPKGAMIIGLCAGLIPMITRARMKSWTTYHQTIEIFLSHALGGIIGLLLTGFLFNGSVATSSLPSATAANSLSFSIITGGLWIEQTKAVAVTLILTGAASAAIAFALRNISLRQIAKSGIES